MDLLLSLTLPRCCASLAESATKPQKLSIGLRLKREQVRRDCLDARRREATDKFYNALLRRYNVRIEPSEEKKEEKKLGQLR